MSLEDFVRTAAHGSFVLTDGTPVSLTAQYELGDVAVSGLSGPYLNEVQEFESRGNFISDAYGPRRYVQITFSAFLVGEAAAAPGSLQAFLTRSTPYGSNISVQGSGRVYAVKFGLNIDGASFGVSNWATVFNNCAPVDMSFGESLTDGDRFSFTLRCRGAVTGSLAAAEI